MVIRFDRLHSVDVVGVNLEDEAEVSRAIGKSYGLDSIPVERIHVYYIEGEMVELPKEIHLYKCDVPIMCTAVSDHEPKIYYWLHDAYANVLRPILREHVADELKLRLKELKEIPPEVVKEIKEAAKKELPVILPERVERRLPSEEDIADNPSLVMELPESMRIRFGARVYDRRWYNRWRAKMMIRGGGFKRLYSGGFLKLTPEEMVQHDAYGPALFVGRVIEKTIDDLDMAMLGISDELLHRYRPY